MKNYVSTLKSPRATELIWWALLLVCLVYAGFAFEMFRVELNRFFDVAVDGEIKTRESPIAFMLHAILGGIGLVAGALQFNSQIRLRNILIHRLTGGIYLLTIWGASTTGVWNAFYFEVPIAANAIFVVVGVWWFFSTSVAYYYIRQRAVSLHKRWMIRSYATSLFFIAFPIWVPTLQMFTPDAIAWPAGLLGAAAMNGLAAELIFLKD